MDLSVSKPKCLTVESVNIQKTDILDADNFSCRNIKNRRKFGSDQRTICPKATIDKIYQRVTHIRADRSIASVINHEQIYQDVLVSVLVVFELFLPDG